jgi:hypothetical protein
MMMLAAVLVAVLEGQAPAAPAAPVVLPPASQIAAAVQAAPEDRRAGATVLGYDAAGALVTLRAGTNDIVCLADDPKEAAFSVACYHKDLEPFMARGRELVAKGIKGKEREETRWKEIESGAIKMPREPRTLHVLSGSGFDPATGTIADAYLRWVIYTPFATPETTGLPIRPVPGGPWLMFPGTPTAHIMINPAKVAK